MSEENTSNINQETNENTPSSNLLTFEEDEQFLNSNNRIISEPQSVIVKVEYPPENKETPGQTHENFANCENAYLCIV